MGNESSSARGKLLPARPQVTLLGDSTIDNGTYTNGGPTVVDHVLEVVTSPEWNGAVTSFAVDGSLAQSVLAEQLPKCEAVHSDLIFVSVGGNDGLRKLNILKKKVGGDGCVEDALEDLYRVVQEFKAAYEEMVEALVKFAASNEGAVVSLCTIYNPRVSRDIAWLGVSTEATHLGVALFDDVIISTARKHGLIVVDLRALFTDPQDFANPIEPSAEGGKKMALAVEMVMEFLKSHGKPTQGIVLPLER
eukprot:TRINITY_DN14600_c0_g1_i1.p1 TRINITY_DN14600_c0_g1~~TRINITY_DN14600_c0_g1_i1.p1  ORF type:complete len:257 (+),score=60.44 TRINITY_DN14600_c0_g1_i1:27-773(+)